MPEDGRGRRASDVGDTPAHKEWAGFRWIAWAVVATGSAVLAAFSIATDIEDRRGGEFFEEGDGWLLSHMIGGAAICVTVAAIVVLILTPIRDHESSAHRWIRAGWSLVGVVVFMVAMRLLRAILVGAGA